MDTDQQDKRTEPCPDCHRPNRLTAEEASKPGYVCYECYAQTMSAVSEGMAQFWPTR